MLPIYRVWIDLEGDISNNWWWSKTGESLSYNNWGEAEPNNLHLAEFCVMLYLRPYQNAYWVNKLCTDILRVACETTR